MLGQPQESKQIKRLENAIRELARITIAQDRDTVMLGSISRDQRGEFYRCLSCDNHPIPMEDLQRGPLDVLPSLAAATPQAYMGRDKVLHPDRIRTAAASPERITSRGRVYSSSSVAPAAQAQAASSPVAWQQEGAGESESSGSPPRAAVYSNLPTVLSTSQQMAHGLSMRMESFAPYSDMPPPQFHGRGAAMRRDQQNGLTRSSELPSISSPKPRTANGSPLRGTAQPAQQP